MLTIRETEPKRSDGFESLISIILTDVLNDVDDGAAFQTQARFFTEFADPMSNPRQ